MNKFMENLVPKRNMHRKERKEKKKQLGQQIMEDRFNAQDPEVGLLGEHSGNFDYSDRYPPKPIEVHVNPPPSSWSDDLPEECSMFLSCPSWTEDEFPPLDSETPQDQLKHVWKIHNPMVKNPDGSSKTVTAAEAMLN